MSEKENIMLPNEFKGLKSQFATASRSGRRSLLYTLRKIEYTK